MQDIEHAAMAILFDLGIYALNLAIPQLGIPNEMANACVITICLVMYIRRKLYQKRGETPPDLFFIHLNRQNELILCILREYFLLYPRILLGLIKPFCGKILFSI